MDTSDQLAGLARHMSDEYSKLPLTNPDAMTFHGVPVEISDTDFRAIPHTDDPAAAAYVDGGNAVIFRSPMFAASLNRVYCSAFRGSMRLDPLTAPRVQFLTLMRNVPSRRGVERKFDVFAEGGQHDRCIPSGDSIEGAAAAAGGGKDHRLHALARGMSEWLMAAAAARGMGRGGMVVIDGSLFAWRGIEEHLMLDAFAVARERGVVMCGLSKTTGLLMDSGRPLVDYAMDRGPAEPWYVPLGDVWGGAGADAGKSGTFIVKLHAKSKYVYRLDIASTALELMGWEGTERVLASLVANSGDAHIPGYPYGLVDADRFAQVRNDEAARYGEQLRALLSPGVRDSADMQDQHGDLNEVTS